MQISKFLILGIILVQCSNAEPNLSYDKALKLKLSGESQIDQIIFDGAAASYKKNTVVFYGYLDIENSNIHADTSFLLKNRVNLKYTDFVKLYNKEGNLLKPDKCKGGNNLVELQGFFDYESTDGKDIYLVSVDKIYLYDNRPINQGGGKKHQCYPLISRM